MSEGAKPRKPPDPTPVKPLKPRPKLFAVLCLLFALWVALLVSLYFKTVYPRRSTVPGYDEKGRVEGAPTTLPS